MCLLRCIDTRPNAYSQLPYSDVRNVGTWTGHGFGDQMYSSRSVVFARLRAEIDDPRTMPRLRILKFCHCHHMQLRADLHMPLGAPVTVHPQIHRRWEVVVGNILCQRRSE